MKRVFDVIVAAIILLLTLPLFALIAAAIWLDDRGPIIYRGLRVGLGGQTFFQLKFRTMTVNQTLKSEVTLRDDPRVTCVGRFLRNTKLDELPQLINVLRGDMSLVGPRPETLHYVASFTPEQRAVLSVRPGITGLAQLSFRYHERLVIGPDPERYYLTVLLPAKLAINLDYVRKQSFWLDLKIIALTFIALVRPFPLPPLSRPEELGSPAALHDARALFQDMRANV